MKLRMYMSAAGMFLASWFMRGRRVRSPRHHGSVLVTAVASAMLGSTGCTSVDVVMLSSESYTSQMNHVEILERAPTRPYVKIAVLSVDSIWLSYESKRDKLLEKAATLGADAVIFGDLRLPQSNQASGQVEQVNPPASLQPQEVEKQRNLHSSYRGNSVSMGASVFLVRGGHGGGHGHGRHGGGHSGFRHWGRVYAPYYGPGFWGYGRGGWGYAPYWGGYYPYYGYAPYAYGTYPGYAYGYVIGTAIHYTD